MYIYIHIHKHAHTQRHICGYKISVSMLCAVLGFSTRGASKATGDLANPAAAVQGTLS